MLGCFVHEGVGNSVGQITSQMTKDSEPYQREGTSYN